MFLEEQQNTIHHSLFLKLFSRGVEWGNRWFTISGLILKGEEHDHVFKKLEVLIAGVTLICIILFFTLHLMPFKVGLVIAGLLVQRFIEFFIVYSRNFILMRGRIYSHFHDEELRGQWLIMMFGFNILQLLFVFATWYHFISLNIPNSFNHPLGLLDSLYFSVVTFMTLGHAQISPLSTLPQILVIFQSLSFFFILVVVINGLISLHFKR